MASYENSSGAYTTYYEDPTTLSLFASFLQIYYLPLLIVTGIAGNFLSVNVFFYSKLGKQSIFQYLTALAVSDSIFLLQQIPPWLRSMRLSLLWVRPGFCQVIVYNTYVTTSISSWLVVAFTVERFIAVLYPLRSRTLTVRRARCVIGAIVATCVLACAPLLWLTTAHGSDCGIDTELLEEAALYNALDTCVSFTLPLVTTTVLNICIVYGVWRGNIARRNLAPPPRPTTRYSLAHPPRRIRPTIIQQQQRVTKMLLIVSSTYVLLNVPAYTIRVVEYASNMSFSEFGRHWEALQQIGLQFFNTNFGINFFLYCLSGENFRKALWHTFPTLKRFVDFLRRVCCCIEPPQPSSSFELASGSNSISIVAESASSAARGSRGSARAARRAAHWWHRGPGERRLQPCRDLPRPVPARPPVHVLEVLTDYTNEDVSRTTPYVVRLPVKRLMRTQQQAKLESVESFKNFQPIPVNLEPGQIAPFGFDSVSVSPSLDPSPSPQQTFHTQKNVEKDDPNVRPRQQVKYFNAQVIQREHSSANASMLLNPVVDRDRWPVPSTSQEQAPQSQEDMLCSSLAMMAAPSQLERKSPLVRRGRGAGAGARGPAAGPSM